MAKKSFTGVGASFANNTSALLNAASLQQTAKAESITWIPAEQVHPNPEEDALYDVDSLDALARDIAERGITNALRVKPDGMGEFIVIGGHRRRAANQIAYEKYGYEKGEKLPCFITSAPAAGREFESTEDMILDNLQRDKTDFNRMMEIVKFKECTEARRRAGEDIPVVRDRIKERLGVSDSEITRFEKIYNSLHKELMPYYRAQKIATSVAYEIARLEEEIQEFIVQQWDKEEPLNLPLMNVITAKYYDLYAKGKQRQDAKPEAEESEEPARKKTISIPKPESIDEGMDMLSKSFTNISTMLSSERAQQLSKKDKGKLLKRIQKEMSVLMALQNDLAKLGLTGGVTDGE